MEIYDYIIPKRLQSNSFINSLYKQYTENSELSIKQIYALEDMLDVRLDFFNWDFNIDNIDSVMLADYNSLIAKLERDRFRKNKTRNTCIRAIESIIEGNPMYSLIDKALGRDFYPGWRYR